MQCSWDFFSTENSQTPFALNVEGMQQMVKYYYIVIEASSKTAWHATALPLRTV